MQWAKDFEIANRIVAFSKLFDGTEISTVWLGLDHSFLPSESPKIFETMVFSDRKDLDGYMERYSTEQEAIDGHKKICEEMNKKVNNAHDTSK